MKVILAVVLSLLMASQNVSLNPAGEQVVYKSAMAFGQDKISEVTEMEEESTAEETAGSDVQAGTDSGAAGPQISAPSAILMEASTGTVIFEKDADTARPPASVTKVMTMLLIFDALESGKIRLEDEVTTSEFAASMGGSQVFLEPGETQTVDTMLKCISVASANDACVAFKNSRQQKGMVIR